MKVSRAICTMLIMTALSACSPDDSELVNERANPEKTAATKDSINGAWEITYIDNKLGRVTGRAFVDTERGSVEVRFTDPTSGQEIQLTSSTLSINGNKVSLNLDVRPQEGAHRFKALGDNISTKGHNLSLSLGETEKELSLSKPENANGGVTLKLKYYADADSLSGEWHRSIDAVSGLTKGINGRSGYFSYGSQEGGGATLTGSESWRRPVPVIKTAFSISDQFAASLLGPSLPYPYPNNTKIPTDQADTDRYVMLYGKNLPHDRREIRELISLDPNIDYYAYELMGTYKRRQAESPSGKADTYWRDKGFDRIDRLLEAGKPPFIREDGDEFIILEAQLKPGIEPGYMPLKINGVETAWLLRFGDPAIMGFVSDLTQDLRNVANANEAQLIDQATIPIETQFTDIVYGQQQIYLEIRMAVATPTNEFPVVINLNGKTLIFDGKRNVMAKRSTNPDEPMVYRTAPIYLIQPGSEARYPKGAITISVQQKDILRAYLGSPQVLNLGAQFTEAVVVTTPADVQSVILDDWSSKGMVWRDAVFEAVSCADYNLLSNYALELLQNIATGSPGDLSPAGTRKLFKRSLALLARIKNKQDINAITREEADYFSDWVISNIWRPDVEAKLTTSIRIGEHAASILMRPMLVALLQKELKEYQKPLNDIDIVGFRNILEHSIVWESHVLKKISVSAPKGEGSIWLEQSYFADLMKERYGLEGATLRKYQIQAMREARNNISKEIRTSIEHAKAADTCDVREMIFLTGVGMENVQRRINAVLMKLVTETNNQEGTVSTGLRRAVWVPDRQALAHVANLVLVTDMLYRQELLSNDEWNRYTITLSVLSMPLGLTSIEVFIWASFAIDATDLVVNILQESSQQYGEEQELSFALGASAVLGAQRYELAKERDKAGYISWFKVLMSGTQTGFSTADVLPAAALARSIKRGNKLIKNVRSLPESRTSGNLQATRDILKKAMNELKPAAQRDVLVAINHALRLEAAIGRKALEAPELKALIFARAVESAGHGVTRRVLSVPSWATAIGEVAFRRIEHFALRGDIIRLVDENPTEMTRLIMDNNGLYLMHLPQTDLASLQRAVRRYNERAPTRGKHFVDQTDAIRGDPEGEGLFFGRINETYEGDYHTVDFAVFDGIEQGATRYGMFVRGRQPDTIFGSGKDFFVFDLAQTFRQFHFVGRPSGRLPFSPAPRWINDVATALRDNAPGMPFVMFANLRLFKSLDFNFADPDMAGIMLKNVQSANTAAQLHWLRHTYPHMTVNELFRYTHSYQYAENTAQQLGFRITEIEVRGAIPGEPGFLMARPLDDIVEGRWFEPIGARTAEEADTIRRQFADSYRVPANPNVPLGFDVYLKVEPL